MPNTALRDSLSSEDAARDMVNRALAVTQSDNFAPYFDFFTDDARWMMPSSFNDVGLEKAKSFYSFTEKFRFEQNLHIDELIVTGDLAVARISLDGYLKHKFDAQASLLRSVSRHIWLLKRQPNGDWKIHCDIWNNPKKD